MTSPRRPFYHRTSCPFVGGNAHAAKQVPLGCIAPHTAQRCHSEPVTDVTAVARPTFLCCHSEPVTDVTGVPFRPASGGANSNRGQRPHRFYRGTRGRRSGTRSVRGPLAGRRAGRGHDRRPHGHPAACCADCRTPNRKAGYQQRASGGRHHPPPIKSLSPGARARERPPQATAQARPAVMRRGRRRLNSAGRMGGGVARATAPKKTKWPVGGDGPRHLIN